jgi:peptidoglycan/xylan/chitin deacetylase (PgdA/CDA1 family)
MLKSALKRAVSESFGRLLVRRPESRVLVLCYHSIHPSLPFASASPHLFRAHLEFLTGACDVVSLSEIPALARGGERDRPAVALTFDDGYRDNYTHAFPLLDEAGATATFFVTVGLLEQDPAVLGRLADIRGTSREDVSGMSWEQARELVSAGHEVASHTWSHPVLADLDAAATRTEVVRAKEVLEDRLGVPVTSFAYPFGKPGRHFTEISEQIVRDAGHTRAVAILAREVRAGDAELALPRFFATRDDIGTLAAKVAGRWDWLGLWQEHTPRWLARLVSPADFRDLGAPR